MKNWVKLETNSENNNYGPLLNKVLNTKRLIQDNGTFEIEYDEDFYLQLMEENYDQESIEIVISSINLKKSILIYGDYDVDGITSTYILYDFLTKLGADVSYFIPSRHEDGYGLNFESLQKIDKKFELLITVDCGITSVKEVDYLKEKGIEVIITDHHNPGDLMINTHVINPQLGYGYKYLSGVGTVLSFILNIADTLNKKINEDYYAFASIGTIADLMPLNDINRHLVIKGLDILNKTNNMGLALLLNKLSLEDKTINAYDVAFKIAPRINAAGRMDHAYRALELFINPREKIAQELMELNLKRQETEEYVLNNILNSIDLEQDIIIGYGSSLNDGVIGIVASRLVDKFKKPVIVFNLDNGIAKGSARSYGEIDLFNELSKFKSFFEKFGGHSQAAGLSIKEENFFSFKKKIEEYFSKEIPQWMKIQKIYYVDSVNAKEITIENVLELNILEPFGMGNLKPLFRFGPMNVENSKTIGKNNEHLSIKFSFDNATFNGVYFNYKDNSLKSNSIIECLGYLEINDFKGIKSIQIIIKDLIIDYKPSKINENELEKKIINYFKERKKVKGTLAIISKKFSLDETSTKSLLLNLQSNGFIEIQEKDGELFIISLDK